MEAGKRSINDLFNGNKILEIPFFQRSYVWDSAQWERFLADMEHVSILNKPYFLGSVILKQQLTTSGHSIGDKRTVIDGQQRITTLNIFFKVLSLKTKNGYLEAIFRLPMNENEIALLHNHNDVDAFNNIMNLKKEDSLDKDDNISRCYSYFSKNIDTTKIEFKNILTNIMFVGIDLGVDEDEQQIFDTINSLGVRLTTAELLKNYFFGRNEIKEYVENWQTVFEPDKEGKEFWDTQVLAGRSKRYFIDLFFYSYLQIKIQEPILNVSSEDKDEFSKVEGLFDSYKKFISTYNINKKLLIKEIKDYALIFRDNFDAGVTDRELSGIDKKDRINAIIFGLESTTLIPYVLFVLTNAEKSEQEKIFAYLESYIMRRMVCHASTKNYNQLFSERLIGNKILTMIGLKEYFEKLADKTNYMPSDDDLLRGFKDSKLTNKQSAGILYMIESAIRNRSKHSTGLLGLARYSLEHIMPKKWENHWGKLSNENDINFRNRKLLTLGNLTIIPASLNSSIRDGAWDQKKNGKGTKNGLKHYASGLDTFSQFLSLSVWNENEISNRADFLYKESMKLWIS